jgi:hypothetical protein
VALLSVAFLILMGVFCLQVRSCRYEAIVCEEFVGAVRPDTEGVAREAILYERSWRFDLGAIDVSIHVYGTNAT